MTAPWITDQPPTYRDADSRQHVIVSTDIDSSRDNCALMHWTRAAQGNLPWRHTSRWVPPKPEPPAPVIVTPEEEPEAATPEISGWITDRVPAKVDADEDGKVICTSPGLPMESWWREKWWGVTPGTPWKHTTIWKPEPASTTPKPKPEKATRGFLSIYRGIFNNDFIEEYAVATDHTAWWRCGHEELMNAPWVQIRPLPQPGEE